MSALERAKTLRVPCGGLFSKMTIGQDTKLAVVFDRIVLEWLTVKAYEAILTVG